MVFIMNELLEVKDLQTSFHSDAGEVKAVNGVSFHINHSESVALVGESGCGKSITALSILGLLPPSDDVITEGEVLFEGEDLLTKQESQLRRIRGGQISIVFQDPMTSLNPVQKVGYQISEVLKIHKGMGKKAAFTSSIELLKEVGIPRAEEVAHDYPHQLSGGMRQRVLIAIAIACEPKLIIADEPTTALDVTIQAEILDLLKRLIERHRMALLLITHDLGVVAETCDRVLVMYAGKIVEESDVVSLFEAPQHPYTVGLLRAMPTLDRETEWLDTIPGSVPSPASMPAGCAFSPRCEHAMDRCFAEPPPKFGSHKTLCWLYEQNGGGSHHG